MKTVEFSLYTLKPGTGNEFHRIMKEQSAPCHRAAGMDIVSFGNSVDDNDAYYLIRAYEDLTHLNAGAHFYSSPPGEGPRQAIIDRISVSVKTVMLLKRQRD
jgi:hypothetical protein